MLLNDQPLWMPQGSIRSLLAIGIVAGAAAGLVGWDIAGIVTAYYFAARSGDIA